MVRIPQNNIIKAGLKDSLDLDDLVILSFVHHFLTGDGDKYRKTVEVEGEEFYRVHYPTILEKWPTLGIKSRGALTARFRKYIELGLLEKYLAPEHTLYVRPTDLLNRIYSSDPLSSDEDSVFTAVNGPVHDGEEPIHDGEQTVHENEHGVHDGEEHNKGVKSVNQSLIESGADFVRAKETSEKSFLTSADASALSLKDKRRKEFS